MAQLRDLVFLLPSYELEGYPRHLPSDQAADLLGGWLSLWHPSLIAAAQAIPRWQSAERLPSELGNTIFILPELSAEHVSAAQRDEIAQAAGQLVEPHGTWRELQAELLQRVPDLSVSELASEFVDQFVALGYAYLQIQLMTRQLRYTSNLDQLLFSEQACKAVDALAEGDRATAEQMLQACFDSLGQERDHYYSLDVNLLDVTLLAESTLGRSLAQQLESELPTTVLASASLMRKLASEQADNFNALKQRLESHQLCIAGGLDRERPHPLMPRAACARDLWRGRTAYQQLELTPPRVFGRLSFGMSPDTASLLRRFDFDGVFLTAWTNGAYPEGSQAKISWEATDGTFMSALASTVLDASDPASFLSLGWSVGEALDHQHVPTIVFAHWPGRVCEFYGLLKIIADRTPALGRWMLADGYFADTDQPYHQERLAAGSFALNWLVEQPAPAAWIRRVKSLHRLAARSRSLQNLLNLSWQLQHYRHSPVGDASPTTADSSSADEAPASYRALPIQEWSAALALLHDQQDSLLDDDVDFEQVAGEADKIADQLRLDALEALHVKLSRADKDRQADSQGGRLILNPFSCPMRQQIHTPAAEELSAKAEWSFASGRVGNDVVTCVDVPAMGFVVAPSVKRDDGSRSKSPVLADAGGLLQNEFLEAQIDSGRGHLRSLHVPARRGNRLSMMVAHRQRNEKGTGFSYSEMVASNIRMLTSSSMCGLIRASGRLEKQGEKVGKFEIDYEVWRGSRVLEVIVRLSELQPLGGLNPWKSAYTLRVAWPTEAAILRTFAAGSRQPWPSGRAVSPELIEIDETDYKTHLLTAGMAFHRRTEERFLETILAVGDQTEVTHRFGIGVDLPSPEASARRMMDERYELPLKTAVAEAHGWLVSVDVRSVNVDLETPLVDSAGELVGVRLFVSEWEGKSTNAKIRLFREVAAAKRVDYLGGQISKLTTNGDAVTIALRANEQVNVDVLWKL